MVWEQCCFFNDISSNFSAIRTDLSWIIKKNNLTVWPWCDFGVMRVSVIGYLESFFLKFLITEPATCGAPFKNMILVYFPRRLEFADHFYRIVLEINSVIAVFSSYYHFRRLILFRSVKLRRGKLRKFNKMGLKKCHNFKHMKSINYLEQT